VEREKEKKGEGRRAVAAHLYPAPAPTSRSTRRLIEFPPSFKSGEKGLAIYSRRRMRLLSSVRIARGEPIRVTNATRPYRRSSHPALFASLNLRTFWNRMRLPVVRGKFEGSRHFQRFYALLKRHVIRSYLRRLPLSGLRSITVVEFYTNL